MMHIQDAVPTGTTSTSPLLSHGEASAAAGIKRSSLRCHHAYCGCCCYCFDCCPSWYQCKYLSQSPANAQQGQSSPSYHALALSPLSLARPSVPGLARRKGPTEATTFRVTVLVSPFSSNMEICGRGTSRLLDVSRRLNGLDVLGRSNVSGHVDQCA